MKKIFTLLLVVTTLFATSGQNYSLKDIVNGKFGARGASTVTSSYDGKHYYRMSDDRSAVVKYDFASGKSVDTLFNTRKARECDFENIQGFLVSPDENRVLIYREKEQIYRRSFKATYFYHDVRRNLVRKLTDNIEKQMIPTFSPDGKMVAYVCDNNIWISKFDFNTESQVTKDGEFNKIINGSTDWVYEEEFTTTRLMEFSPDNKMLAFVTSDESDVPTYSFQTYNKELYPKFYTYKYPKPGEKNSSVVCKSFDIAAGTTRELKVPLDEDGYIPRIKFTNDASKLAVMTLNRNQNRLDMYFADPRTTEAKLAMREENKYYIDSESISSIRFIKDGFLYISEREGFSSLYHFSNDGQLKKKLTGDNFDVTALLAVDDKAGLVYYQAADESPLQRSIFKVNIKNGKSTKLSNRKGYNSAIFSNKGHFFINMWSDTNTPTIVSLHNSNGKELKVLEDNAKTNERVIAANFPSKEYIIVPSADGVTQLNAWIMKPNDFDPAKQYPLVMVQYSGPNSQQVTDRFRIDWYHAFVNEGFIVACVDGRGTGARGEEFRKQTYLNLGLKESDDQIAAARYFGTLSYVDSARIGIWGWSFGGYNVLMSMSRGEGVFKAGVSIAPVTDWKLYDTVYTERFMRTPGENPDGYKTTSAMHWAKDLKGSLLLVHGMSDDNVHVQNSMEYVRTVIDADKQIDMFMIPDKDHSIVGGNSRFYLYTKVIDYYKKNL